MGGVSLKVTRRGDDPVGPPQVVIDGRDVSDAVAGLRLVASLDLVVDHLPRGDTDDVVIEISEQTREVLVGLGWTPPAGTDKARKGK